MIINEGKLSEKKAKTVMRQVFQALNYMHQSGYAHRLLTPENILLGSGIDDIKLLVSGLGAKCGPNDILTEKLGTPYYIAPEILN